MDCKETRELLPEHADGRLDAVRAEAVRTHLEGCADCRREQALLAGTWEFLKRYPTIESDVLSGVRRRVRHPVWRALRIGAPLAAAAAILVVVALVVRTPRGPEPVDPVQAEVEKLPPQDRELLLELSRDENRELIEDMELIDSFEVLAADHLNEDLNGH